MHDYIEIELPSSPSKEFEISGCPSRFFYINKVSGTRAKRLVEKALAEQTKNESLERKELLVTGLTSFYVEKGIKAFDKLDFCIQSDVVAWIESTKYSLVNSPSFKFKHRTFSYHHEYGDVFDIRCGHPDIFITLSKNVISSVSLRDLFDVEFSEDRFASTAFVDGTRYRLAKSFSEADCVKAALGLISIRNWAKSI